MRWCFSTLRSITALAAAMVVAGPAAADDPIPDDALGLSRTSVFDTPVPEAYDYEGSASRIDLQTSRQAPVIPHEMRAYESITTGRNRCLRCHMEPALIGTEIPAGEATPMPADHYLQLGDDENTAKVSGSRWVCTQCHVGQVNVAPLVDNSSVN
jgi:cytochrome c-type protein NapB